MASDPQDPSSVSEEFSRDSGDLFLNNYDFPTLNLLDEDESFYECVQSFQEGVHVDKTSRYATCVWCRQQVGANRNLAFLQKTSLTKERQTSSISMPWAVQPPPC